jgi:RIO-like serine/threonine protein kinase
MDILKLAESLTHQELDKVLQEIKLMNNLGIIHDYCNHFDLLVEEGMSVYQATYHTYYKMVTQPGSSHYKPEFRDKIKEYYSNSY